MSRIIRRHARRSHLAGIGACGMIDLASCTRGRRNAARVLIALPQMHWLESLRRGLGNR
jgi:hypothetical protein